MPDETMNPPSSTSAGARPKLSPLWLLPIAVVVAVVLGATLGRGAFFLALAGGALLGAIWTLWQSLQSLTGDAPLTLEEAIGMGAPSVEEERKAAVLRALKDLEYERHVGKITEDDFQELSRKYREEAKALLQLVDSDLAPARARVEQLVEQRLAASGSSSGSTSPNQKAAAKRKTPLEEPVDDE